MIELIPGDNGTDAITMHCEKQRDGAERFDDIGLRLEKIDLGVSPVSGMEISSCVVTLSTAPDVDTGTTKQAEKEARLLKVCNLLRLHGAMNTRMLIDSCKDIGISKKVFYDEHILEMLLERKAIIATPGARNGVTYSLESKGAL